MTEMDVSADPVDFVTDTACFCVFDIASLSHRVKDDCDWWSVSEEELKEINSGNVVFVGLGEDGKYRLHLVEAINGREGCAVVLNCPSGRLFMGAGEEVTGGGLQPEAVRGGLFMDVDPGKYLLTVRRDDERDLAVSIVPFDGAANNEFSAPLRI